VRARRTDQISTQRREKELERLLRAEPAATWPEAGAKAFYLLTSYAKTREAQGSRQKALIANTLFDLARMSRSGKERL
jgi:hypothetical protein